VPARPNSPSLPQSSLLDELLALMGQLGHSVGAVAEAQGLTPQQLFLLRGLSAPRPMYEVAAQMCCDRSNVTGMIDRLESRGLVERTPGEADRRVKMLSLTTEGRALRRKLEGELVRHLVPRDSGPAARRAIEQVRRMLSRNVEAQPPSRS
jgi:DNA-binding MarR family transcriptional regulator